MSDDINLFISNGTCYLRIDLEADEAMIPCGNDANDHVACCQAGDNCLESSVCFNSDFGVTYLAGCTDPDYEHPSCPNKFEFIGEWMLTFMANAVLLFALLTMAWPHLRNALGRSFLLQWHKQRVGDL